MAARPLREFSGKKLASRWLEKYSSGIKYDLEDRALLITPASIRPEDAASFDALAAQNPWLLTEKLVVKPDQLIKRRGKAGLLAINKTWPEVVAWIKERMNKECKVEVVSGILDHFIVEPFVPHAQTDEYYLCIQSFRENDEVLFYHEGGVDVGDVDAKGVRLQFSIGEEPTIDAVVAKLLQQVPASRQQYLAGFIVALTKLFRDLNFVYMEINPLVMTDDGRITPLDMAAKIDETAHFLNAAQWGAIEVRPSPTSMRPTMLVPSPI
jgi:ATP citrate (pro-S)-lyase